MTTPSEAYLASLKGGEAASALDAAESAIEREEGPAALVRCLEARLVLETDRRASPEVLEAVRRRAASACEEVARASDGEAALQAALRAVELRQQSADDEGAARAAELVASLALDDGERGRWAVERMGGAEEATLLLRRRLKSPEVKKDPAKSAGTRRVLARLAEALGDADAAFFEMLGAVRKAPEEPLYVDEAFRLALATERYAEVSAVFRELAADEAIPARLRATLYNKIGHVAERGLDDLAAALTAYEASLALNPESKGARRHADRLRELLEAQAAQAAGTEPLLVDRGPYMPPSSERTPRPDESAPLRSIEVTSPGREVLSSSAPSFVDLGPAPPVEAEGSAEAEESVGDEDVLEETPRHISFDDLPLAETAPSSTASSSSLPPPVPEDDWDQESTPRLPPPVDDDWDHDSAARLPPPLPDEATAVIGVFDSDVDTALDDGLDIVGAEPRPAETEVGAVFTSEVETLEAPSAAPKAKQKKRKKKKHKGAEVAPAPEDTPTRVTPLAKMAAHEPPTSLLSLPDGELPPPDASDEASPPSLLSDQVPAAPAEVEDVADEPATDRSREDPPPPSTAAAPTVEGPAARDLFAEADSLLAEDDIDAALECARALQGRADKGSLALRLAAHALKLSAPGGVLRPEAVALFLQEAAGQGEVVAALALEVRDALPADARLDHLELWLAGARAAGADAARAMALLEDFAREDAPDGPAFTVVDGALTLAGELEGRLALRALAARTQGDPERLRALLLDHVTLLEDSERPAEALPLYARLALEVAPDDEALRARALAAFEAHADEEEHARFLGRLSRAVPGEAGVPILRRLLAVRLSLEDGVGAEAAARDLLERRPGDDEALKALSSLLEGNRNRAAELVELYRLRATIAKNRKDDEERAAVTRALLALLVELERWPEAVEAAREAVRAAPADDLLDEAAALFERAHRFRELCSLYQEASEASADPARRADLLLCAARIARERLSRRGQAEELVEQALEVAPDHVPALLARADLAVELGDAQAALAPLERLAARLTDAAERAQVHFRIGRLLEEHLLRPGDAMKRYRAAVEGSPSHREAWDALRALARQRGDRELHVEALRGLCRLEEEPRLRAALLKQIALIERDERVDLDAAERAFAEALQADPGDEEALTGMLALLAARITGEHDTERALAEPPEALLEAVYEPLAPVFERDLDEGARPAFQVRRLFALALLHQGERERALELLEELLAEAPTDLAALRALAEALDDDDGDDAQRRLKALETVLLHHAPDLDEAENVRLWGEVGALRWRLDERGQARKALRKALELASEPALRAALSGDAVAAIVAALVEETEGDEEPRLMVAALRLSAEREEGEARSAALARAARLARERARDRALCRKLLGEAIEAWPEGRAAREALLDLDIEEGNAESAIAQTRGLLDTEPDPKQRGAYHVRLAELLRRSDGDDDEIGEHLKSALRLAPESREALDAAEAFFEARKDADGLAALYAAQLRSIDPKNVAGRLALLERLAQVRRYDLRDLEGAAEALEAIGALDPDAIKPREDCARIYTELGRWREAVTAWRAVLERDPLASEAWRGLFSIYARTGQADEAFSIAATMTSVEIADDEMARVVRRLRPPFPRWPRAPKDARALRRKIGHPLERTPVRLILDLVGGRAHAVMARPLKDFGLRRKDRLGERQIPPSVLLAVRTVTEMIGLPELPPLYRAQLGSTDGEGPPFALLPVSEPGIVVSDDVLKGGMTPERAFALGRAMAWLMPHAILAGTLEPAALKQVLEALVLRFLPKGQAEGDARALEKLGARLEAEIFRGVGGKDVEALRDALSAALRDYVHARGQLHLADWIAGVGYTADRLGFLLVGDLAPATRVIKSTASRSQALGARLAIKELVLFSASAAFLTLRRELGIALPEDAVRPVLELE